MESANAKKFRAGLKEYMDIAIGEPVRISRRDGQSFVLMSQEIYDDFMNEIRGLQTRLIGLSDIIDDKTKPFLKAEARMAQSKKT